MNICVVDTLNQLVITSILKTKLSKKKKKEVSGKTLFFMIGVFCPPCSICLNIGF